MRKTLMDLPLWQWFDKICLSLKASVSQGEISAYILGKSWTTMLSIAQDFKIKIPFEKRFQTFKEFVRNF